jgi:hypothetical protein
MKIGIISDTHIPERAGCIPEQILEEFKGVDLILHAGDLVTLSVLEELRNICPQVKAVWGNMDPQEVRNILPEKEIIKINSKKIGMVHGFGHPHKLMELVTKVFEKEWVDVIIFGHSHYPVNETRGRVLYFNPGSPTDKIFSTYNSFGILEIMNDEIQAKIIRL